MSRSLSKRNRRRLRRELPIGRKRKATTGNFIPSESAIQLAEVSRVAKLIDRSRLVAETTRIITPNPHLGGKPRVLSVRAFWIVAILLATGRRTMLETEMLAIATRDLPGHVQAELGFRNQAGEALVTIRMFRYLLSTIDAKLAPRMASDDDDRDIRSERLFQFIQTMLSVSLPHGIPLTKSHSLDATAVRTFGRSRRNVARRADKDAAWGPCTRMGQVKNGKTEMFYGYDAHVTAATRRFDSDASDTPEIVTALTLVPAASDVADAGLRLIDHIRNDPKLDIDEVLIDRAYSYKQHDRWAKPLREAGIRQVLDLHPNDQGSTDVDGIQMIAGCAHCPLTPEHLASIRRPNPFAGDKSSAKQKKKSTARQKKFDALIAERQRYKLRLVNNGPESERRQCPALAGTVRCTSRPETIDVGDDLPLVQGPTDIANAPKVCQQQTVTIPHTAGGKLRQEHYWGSPEWLKSYGRRSTIERKFGDSKKHATGKLQHGSWQVVGLVKTSIMFTLCMIAINMRILRGWAERHGHLDADPDLLSPDPAYVPDMTPPEGYVGLPPPTFTSPATPNRIST